jgi:DNA-binding NarL/FixJ family response regulator
MRGVGFILASDAARRRHPAHFLQEGVVARSKSTQDNRIGRRIRLVLADDGDRTRCALRALFATCPDLEVVGDAADGSEVLELVARERPDVVVLDLRMPVLDGLQAAERIKRTWPRVRVLVLSFAAEAREETLAAGADVFVAKGDPEDVLLSAIRNLNGSAPA